MVKSRKKRLDEFHWHEALDRSYLAFEFFQERVEEHETVRRTVELRRQAKEISKRMFHLYQTVAAMTPACEAWDERVQRGRQFSREKFLEMLGKAPDVPPMPGDEIEP